MSLLHLTVSVKIFFTFILSLVYVYLYFQYREKYMWQWSLSWLFFSARVALDLGRYYGFENFALILVNLIFSILSVIYLLLGIYGFTGKKLSKWWLICCGAAVSLSITFQILSFSIVWVAFPTAFFFGLVNIWTGIMVLRFWEIKGLGTLITGYALILLGLNNLSYPFTGAIQGEHTTNLFLIGSILEIIILLGVLLLYFQKVRLDLSKSEERFRLLAENAADIIYRYSYGKNRGFEYISPVTFKITGYTPEEFYADHKLIFTIVHPDDLPILKGINQVVNNKSGPILIRVQHKDGRIIWTEHQFTRFEKAGQLIAIQGVIRDITERKKVEQEMARLDRLNLIGEMAAGISHEIRNPVTVVRGFLQLLEQKSDFLNYKNYFELMINELDRANSIIGEYLSLAKNKIIDLKSQNINEVIGSILPLMEADAMVSEISIEADLSEIPNCLIDENEIKQMILNFFRNSLEAMPGGSILKIKTYRDKNEVVLSIEDQGCGIDKSLLDKLGTPFFTTKDNGSGLGLAICYSIASRHNAKIFIETSTAGTTVLVKFKPI